MVTTVSTPFSFAQKGDTPQNEVAFFRHFLPPEELASKDRDFILRQMKNQSQQNEKSITAKQFSVWRRFFLKDIIS